MKKLHLLIPALTVWIMATGCTEQDTAPGITTVGGNSVLTLTLDVPGISTATRTLDEKDESKVNTLDVLVFEIDGTDEKYLYATHGSVTGPGGTSWRVPLQVSGNGKAHRLVLLANLQGAVEAAYQAGEFYKDRDKDDLLPVILFDASGTWDTTTPDYLPMWGETGEVLVSINNISTVAPVKMVRSVARIDLFLKKDDQKEEGVGLANFTLDEVKVYNASEKGYAVPDPDNMTGTQADDPTVSSSFARTARSYPLSADQKKYGLWRDIYIAESDNNISGMAYEDQTCLVISGYWESDPSPTWYRIDFQKEVSPTLNWDILRNHRYAVNVTSVDGRGYDTEGEALRSRAANIKTEVEVWDEADIPDVSTDGQYYLKINTDSLHFYKEGRKQLLVIETDHPDGWSLEIVSPEDGWVTASTTSGLKNSKDSTYVECTGYTPGSPLETHRDGYITIKAGKIRRNIKIYQVPEEELTITVTPDQISFRKSGASPKSITVTVYPESSLVHFSETPGDKPISWLTGPLYYNPPAANLGTYPIQPGVNTSDPKAVLSSMITVYIVGSDGIPVGKNVTVRQYADDLVFSPKPANPYPALGAKHTFQVESDTDWQVYTSTDPGGMIPQPDMELKPAGTVNYTIDLQNNNTWNSRTAQLHVKSNDPDFAGQPIVITQNAPPASLELSTTTLDVTGSSGTVQVNSNAFFNFSKGTGYGNVVSGESISVGTNGNENPIQVQATPVTFNKVNYTGAAGTPAAGNIAGTATFTSTGHPGTAITRNLTINQTVPAFFTLNTGTTTIARTQSNVTVSANTNAAWNATPSTGTASANQAPGAWAQNKTATVTIPANTAWTSPYNKAVNRQITVTARYGATTSAINTVGGTFTVNQPGYYYSSAAVSATSTPTAATGGSATIRLVGDYPNTAIVSRVSGTTTNLASATVTASTNNTAAVSIPAHTLWTTRDVVVGYLPAYNTNTFIQLGSYKQVARYSTSGASTTMPTSFSGAQTYSITVTGSYPVNSVQYQITGTQNGTLGPYYLGASSSSSTANFTIPANTVNRTITLQYKTPTMSSFSTVRTATQTRPPSLTYSASWESRGNTQKGVLTLNGYWPNPIRVFGIWGGHSVYVDVPAGTSATVELNGSGKMYGRGSVGFSFSNPANNNNTVTINNINGETMIKDGAPTIGAK